MVSSRTTRVLTHQVPDRGGKEKSREAIAGGADLKQTSALIAGKTLDCGTKLWNGGTLEQIKFVQEFLL